MTLFTVIYTILCELLTETCVSKSLSDQDHHFRQVIIDTLGSDLKQDRRLYHSAANLNNFQTYNTMYNLLYLVDPSIWQYQYNHVILVLQRLRHSCPRPSDPESDPTPHLTDRILTLLELEWENLRQFIDGHLPRATVEACKHPYLVYRRAYDRGQRRREAQAVSFHSDK